MEISNITGPDIVPTGFSSETSRVEQKTVESADRNAEMVNKQPISEDKGKVIDTFA